MAIIPQEEKVFMVSNSTNTTYSGSAALKAMQQWYTMQDVTDTVKPYKVYTALLTQSGGNDPQTITSGALQIGVSYTISIPIGEGPAYDFSNVGGPISPNNFSFVSISHDIPNNYGNATLSYNTGAPSIKKVLENTIGNIWFTYVGEGSYGLNSDGLFEENNTFCSISTTSDNMDPSATFTIPVVESNVIEIHSDADLNKTDSLLNRTPIEIRVYN